MALTDPESRPSGPLARIGQSDSAAGLSRLGIGLMVTAFGTIIAWGSHDLGVMFDRLNENQRAIVALGDRTTRVEDLAKNAAAAGDKFQVWTEGRVNDLTAQINANGRQLYDIDSKQRETEGRVKCLENRGRCPP